MERLYFTSARIGSWEIHLDYSRDSLDSVSYLLEMELCHIVDHMFILILHCPKDQKHLDRNYSSFYTERDGADSHYKRDNRIKLINDTPFWVNQNRSNLIYCLKWNSRDEVEK